jgi:glycosyltransferase involved in cell wall biosynthesis
MERNMTISAFLPVYNEEKRIRYALDSLMWCDEIILIDKFSTDKTVEIALSYGDKVKVCYFENTLAYDSSEWKVALDNSSSDWIALFTASDVIHPQLVREIFKLIENDNKKIDIIHIPFKRYVLGLDFKSSPWHSDLSPKIVKKTSILINEGGVHDAVNFVGNNFYMSKSDEYCMYHLTHETVDIMMERHLRYWRGEVNEKNISLKKDVKIIFKSFIKLTFFKRLPLLGYDGFMIMFSFMTYQMMSYVYKWERTRGNVPEVYEGIRRKISEAWKC